MRSDETRELTIRGTIFPEEWGEDGNVTSIGIGTEDDEDYFIYLDKMGQELLPFVDRKVEATGTVKSVYGDLILTVKEYSLLKGGGAKE